MIEHVTEDERDEIVEVAVPVLDTEEEVHVYEAGGVCSILHRTSWKGMWLDNLS